MILYILFNVIHLSGGFYRYFRIMSKYYAHFENDEIEVDSPFVPRYREIVSFYHYKKQLGIEGS